MPATKAPETATSRHSSGTRNLHVCWLIWYQFFLVSVSGTEQNTALFHHRNCPARDTNRATWLAGELFWCKKFCDGLVSNFACKLQVPVSGACVAGIRNVCLTTLFARRVSVEEKINVVVHRQESSSRMRDNDVVRVVFGWYLRRLSDCTSTVIFYVNGNRSSKRWMNGMMEKFCTQTRTDHVQDMCWVLCLYRGRRCENNDISLKKNACM